MTTSGGKCTRCGQWDHPYNRVTSSWLDGWRSVSKATCQECRAPSEERTESCGCKVLIIKLAPANSEYVPPLYKELYPGSRRRVLQECLYHREENWRDFNK